MGVATGRPPAASGPSTAHSARGPWSEWSLKDQCPTRQPSRGSDLAPTLELEWDSGQNEMWAGSDHQTGIWER